jgi:hypothetical protein
MLLIMWATTNPINTPRKLPHANRPAAAAKSPAMIAACADITRMTLRAA